MREEVGGTEPMPQATGMKKNWEKDTVERDAACTAHAVKGGMEIRQELVAGIGGRR